MSAPHASKWILVALCLLSAGVQATTVSYTIGDNDGFGGTQGSQSVPGDSFSVFASRAIAPGAYADVAATDVTTQSPWSPYVFTFNFAWDTTSLSFIDSALVVIQSGSVGRRTDGSGFGFAQVYADNGSGEVNLGDFWTTSTDAAGSALEESVKAHTFDVTPFITAGSTGLLTFTIDGSSLQAPVDQFALDFASLTVTHDVPEPGTTALMAFGIAGLAFARARKHASKVLL